MLLSLLNLDNTTIETLVCSGWKTSVVPVSQPELSDRDLPGVATGIKRDLAPAHVAGAPFCLGYQPGQKVPFFSCFLFLIFFYFNYIFAFQLNLCIGIHCVRSPLIYIYTYIYIYIIFVLDSFHI